MINIKTFFSFLSLFKLDKNDPHSIMKLVRKKYFEKNHVTESTLIDDKNVITYNVDNNRPNDVLYFAFISYKKF